MKKIIILIILLVTVSAYALPVNITFMWDKNTEPDLAGYNLYQSSQSGDYSSDPSAVIIGDANQYTYQVEMESGIALYWVLTAFDTSGNESGYSNEVTHTIYIDNNAPAVPQIFHIKNYVIIR